VGARSLERSGTDCARTNAAPSPCTLGRRPNITDLTTDTPDGDSRKRWAIRAEFSPEIGVLPGHQLTAIGFEVSKAFDGGSPSVKITYGVSLSATRGIFRN